MKHPVTIMTDKESARAALADILKNEDVVFEPAHADCTGPVLWIGDADDTPPPGLPPARLFKTPVRLGALLDTVRFLQDQGTREYRIGAYTLNIAAQELQGENTVIRLTEKETHILRLLAAAGGALVSRAEMLRAVWDYADGVETHTLETHIYRLRQKIEKDPAQPRILLTEDTGYRLAV